METSDATAGLSFDRATYSTEGGAAACANCKGPLGAQYWHWQAQAVCEGCRGKLTQILEFSQSKKAFGRALLLGGATAFGCGILYAVFVALTKYQLALITIGIAFVIARVMRKCSAGVGGRRFQILAVILTYLASAMGYAPFLLSGAEKGQVEAAATSKTGDPSASDVTPASKPEPVGAAGLIYELALLLAITLAAPILSATEAPIGLLIVGFGLWEAWKLSRGIPLSLDGPYRTAAATGPPAK